ncbi:MAG: hypothetical protein K0R38_3959 [Polyangiaceae bacterium]|jgi:hypothetical protein|nr:hypothetical protein [Polyangiaceae bacterium]
MPVLVALPLGLCLGVSFAWLSRRELRRVTNELGSRGLAIAALFGLFVLAPISAYFLAFEPDWCLAYLVDTSQATPALTPGLLLVALATVPSGFLLGRLLLERGDEATLLRVMLGLVVATLGAVMLGLRRFAVQGSYAQFHGDFGTQPLAGSSLGYAILVLGFWLTAGLVFAVWNLRRLD